MARLASELCEKFHKYLDSVNIFIFLCLNVNRIKSRNISGTKQETRKYIFRNENARDSPFWHEYITRSQNS